MKKADVKVGKTYLAKVSKKLAEVRIDAERPNGGWDATNLATGKKVLIKSAQRLRAKEEAKPTKKAATPAKGGKGKRQAMPAPVAQTNQDECPRGGKHEFAEGACEKCMEPAPKAKKAKKSDAAKPAKEKKLSALSAAAVVLADTGKRMNVKELIAEIAARGLWKSPGGKTPESTLAAAMNREIAKMGAESRFAKPEPGKFAAAM